MANLQENLIHALEEEFSENEDFPLKLSPVQIQQEFFENLSECDWVKYEYSNRKHLLQNVAFALFGSPTLEGDMSLLSDDEFINLEGYTSRQKEQAINIYNKICEQSKYSQNDEDILLSILLVVCVKPQDLPFYKMAPKDHWIDLHQRNDGVIWCAPVFKIRKCIPTVLDACPCKVYIDENARVYHSWDDFLVDNTLPKCVMVAPEGGAYNGIFVEGEDIPIVKLTVTPSPALGLTAVVLSSADTTNTIVSIGALGVLGVAAFTPVAPVVLLGAGVATITTGLYSMVRSSLHLRDRSVHEQSISVKDSEARNSWLNITASGVGLAAGAASTFLARSAAAGTNMTKTGQALAVSVEVLRRANILTGGVGVINSLVHIILKYRKHGERPTSLELFQFSAATLFFYQAVVSNKTAQNIVEDVQANTINEYRTSLRSNRHRKIFDKVSAETRRIQGTVQGNTEVIQCIKNIANKDQYFADVLKINKDLNKNKLRISMTPDGKVNLNAVHKFNPSELYVMGKEGRNKLFSSIGQAVVSTSNAPTKLPSLTTAVNTNFDLNEDNKDNGFLVGINPGEIIRIGSVILRVSTSGAENISEILQNLSEELYYTFMTIAYNVIALLIPSEIARLRLLSPNEDLLTQIVKFVFEYLKNDRPFGDPCHNNDNGIVVVMKEFFQDGIVRKETILRLKERLMLHVEQSLQERERIFPNKKQIICPTCSGVRFA